METPTREASLKPRTGSVIDGVVVTVVVTIGESAIDRTSPAIPR